ncbi:hypothetical protein B0H11DRAFT_2227419 [Mycena galericulata]|nr:hypothetical protein B0H11DRAFT_2227419 [Mycena galericulata]
MAYRATVLLDLAKGFSVSEWEKINYMNQAWVVRSTTLNPARVAFADLQLAATTYPEGFAVQIYDCQQLALDAADLTFNLRGVGWNFSANMKVPTYTRPLSPSSAYVKSTLRSLVVHVFVFDFLHYFCQSFGPDTLGSTAGGSIYDMGIANPSIRYLRSTLLTFLVGMLIYGAIQIGHDAFSLIGVAIFRQSPSEWPPVFDSPWFATSLTEFWAARWHQVFRQEFIAVGFRPLSLVAWPQRWSPRSILGVRGVALCGVVGNGKRRGRQGHLVFLDDGHRSRFRRNLEANFRKALSTAGWGGFGPVVGFLVSVTLWWIPGALAE